MCRRFSVTAKGYIGLQVSGRQSWGRGSDLGGGSIPYVMREVRALLSATTHPTERYSFVGAYLVHRIMHSEAQANNQAHCGRIILQ